MKTIGLIGGMSWESTVPYYRQINETVKAELGGLHSARVVLYSLDFHEVERLQHAGDWDAAGALLADAARALQAAGAEVLVLCTNTMHKVAPAIEAAVRLPLLHIADPTAEAVRAAGVSRVGLLGTRFTMEQPFYRDRLQDRFGLEVLVPPESDRESVHRIIYDELCVGRIVDASRADYRRVMADLVDRGAQAIILGCTEISLLVGEHDATVPLFDTTALHARAAALWSLAAEPAPGGSAGVAAAIHIRDIDHLVLRVVDLDRMIRFYCEVLGCSVERRQEALGLVQLRAGRSLLDLVPVDGTLGRAGGAPPGAEGRNLDHFCLRIEPFDEAALRGRLAAHGIEAGPVASRYGAEGEGPSLYLTDPEGNMVELKGPPTGPLGAPEPGAS